MNQNLRRTISKASRAHAESQGYTGKRGRKSDSEPHYSYQDFMVEFEISATHAKWILSGNEECLGRIKDYIFTNLVHRLESKGMTINMSPEDILAMGDTWLEKTNRKMKEDFKDLSVGEVRPEDMEVNKLPPKMSDISVSNRLMRVEAKIKEIVDCMENYRNEYHAEMLAAWTLCETFAKASGKDFPDPLHADFFKERSMFVTFLDLMIDRLNKV